MLCPHFCLAASERERQRLNVMSLSESARRRSQSELQSLRSTVLLCFCHFGVLAQRSLLPLLSSAKDWGGSTHKHKHTATFRAIGNNQLWQRVSGPSSAGKGLFLLLVDDSNLVQGQMLTNGRQDSPVLGAGMECLSVWLFVDAGRHRLPACPASTVDSGAQSGCVLFSSTNKSAAFCGPLANHYHSNAPSLNRH